MGLNNEHAQMRTLWLDIETIPRPGAVDVLPPVKAAANLKDPIKVAADIQERTAKRELDAGLDVDLAAVAVVAWGTTVDDVQVASWNGLGYEQALVEHVWGVIRAHLDTSQMAALGGFNNLQFDLPILIRRSQMLGVKAGPLQMGKYRHPGIVDLMQILTWDGLVQPKGLQTYCRLFGVYEAGEDDLAGAEVAGAIADGQWERVERHCLADVRRTIRLADRLRQAGVVW